MDTCRFCSEALGDQPPRFCPACGARLSGMDFDTLPACLVPHAYVRNLRETEYELSGDEAREGEWRRAQDHLVACEDLNRELLHAADRLRAGDETDLVGLMTRGRAEELLEALPRDIPGLPDLRCAVFTLVSDLESAHALRRYELLEAKARKLSLLAGESPARGDARAAARAWAECALWLDRNPHPDAQALRTRVETHLARFTARP